MANPANMMKMLQALGGGMASESYGSPTQGGQPILPKPQISGPGVLSPYAPMNNPEGQRNSGTNQKPSKMGDTDHHPANQLAQYLTMNGRSARALWTNAGDHARGAMVSHSGPVAGVRG